jgi:uncharacterized protein YbjT (DUF2867 family)
MNQSPGTIVAITGASGFVGRNLIPTLAVAGRKVRTLVQTRQLKASKRNDITCA